MTSLILVKVMRCTCRERYADGLLVRIEDESGGVLEAVQDTALQHGFFHTHREAHFPPIQIIGISLSQNVDEQSEKVANDLRSLIRDEFYITPDM